MVMRVRTIIKFSYNMRKLLSTSHFLLLRTLLITVICISALFFSFPSTVLAGSINPPVAALSDSIQDDMSFDSFDEFGLNNNDADKKNQNFSLSNNAFGISGPLSFNITWSDQYDWILNINYASLINSNNAYAIEADLGVKSNRLNLTLGHAISPNNRIKLTVERLAQKQSFDFDSGSIDHWVCQYASGAEVQHLLGMGVLNNVAIGGYYARALDKTLDPVIYDVAGSPWINYRHIAGASSKGFNTSIGIRPWKTGIVTLTGYYDWVHYHNRYESVSASDSSDLGFGFALNQYISTSIQGNFSYVNRATYKTIEAGIQWFHNIFHQTRSLAFSISGSHSSSDNVSHDNSLTIGIQYYFKPIQNIYRIPEFHVAALKNWTIKPAVRMDQVLVAADQMSEAAFISAETNLFSFSTSQVQDKLAENIHWGNIFTNIPNAKLEYHLTILNEKTNLPIIEDKIVTGHDYLVTNIERDQIYKVKLNVIEKTTNLPKEYVDYFQVSASSVSWPDGFNSKAVYLEKEENQEKIKVALYFSSARSDQGLPVQYKITATNDKTQEKPIDQKIYSDEEMKKGLIKFSITPSQDHTLEVIPVVEEHSYDEIKQLDKFKTDPSHGEITWTPNFQIEHQDDPTRVKITWNEAIPAYPSIEEIEYTLVLCDGNNKKPIDGYACDKDSKTCMIDIKGLTPDRSAPSYTLEVTADAKYDDEQTKEFPFGTIANGTIEWPNSNIHFKSDPNNPETAGTIFWNDTATLQDKSQKPTYDVALNGDDAFVDKDTQQCSDGTCSVKVGVKSGVAYTATVTAKAPNYEDLLKTYSFRVPGRIIWGDPNMKIISTTVTTGQLVWNDVAKPTMPSDTINYTIDSIVNTIDKDTCKPGIDDDPTCSGSTCHVNLTHLCPGKNYKVTIKANNTHDVDETGATDTVLVQNITWNNWNAKDNIIRKPPYTDGNAIVYNINVEDFNDVTTDPQTDGTETINFEYKYETKTNEKINFKPLPADGKILNSKGEYIKDNIGVTVTVRAYINGYDDIYSDIQRTF